MPKMSVYKAHECRMWIKEVIIPAAIGGYLLYKNVPAVNEFVNKNFGKTVDKINDVYLRMTSVKG